MTTTTAARTPLAARLPTPVAMIPAVIAGSLLIAVCAQISVPIGPVPVTGQTFGVLLVGALLGPWLGMAAALLYLIEGAVGLPMFASGPRAGIGVLLGPTGGYLLGFVPAAGLVGWLAARGWDRSFWRAATAMTAATAVIFLVGVPWLAAHFALAAGGPEGPAWSAAISLGLMPFLPGAATKIAAAALLLPSAWRFFAWLSTDGRFTDPRHPRG